jgi:ATP-dependent DNA helicase UvrD/PcrA
MITYSHFENIVVNKLKRDISSNQDQKIAISSEKNQSLFIVAGPGSGKTTVMVLKILKFIFVDDIDPKEILATTFTRKAANELNSRILSWGDDIKNHLLKITTDEKRIKDLAKIDFNQIITGTIDSIAEEILRVHRDPGTNLPVVIEEFVANSAMITSGLFNNDRYLNEDLKKYLGTINGTEEVKNPSIMSEILLDIKNRLYYDQVDKEEILKNENSPGAKEALNAVFDYLSELKKRNILDFPMLENRFLDWLTSGKLNIFLNDLKIVLVDEYQDTNLLQEKIYFKLADSAIDNGGSITVVGDDDQSLYRFRGATVDLFTNFIERAKEKLNVEVKEVNLSANYRSTKNIVNLCNHFVELDDNYQSARVKEKPKIEFSRINFDTLIETNQTLIETNHNYGDFKSFNKNDSEESSIPVLGMFRQNQEILAKDLSILVRDLVEGKIVKKKIKKILRPNNDLKEENNFDFKNGSHSNSNLNSHIELKLNEKNGSPSDMAILTYSPKELSYGNYMFPYYLRKNLMNFNKPIEVFNPRGQDLQTLNSVSVFCGLILECIDPERKFQNSINKIPAIAKKNMNKWRRMANEYIDTNPDPVNPISLETFVNCWRTRTPYGHEFNSWPETASLIELAYKIITWVDDLQDDVEGIVYLEAITKTITQTGFFNNYSAQIYFDDSRKEEEKSVHEAIWNIFIPIATGGVSIDEKLLDTLPTNRVNIMSIHQSKGLEFPLVIVDVGSRFQKNKIKTSFLRFPKEGSKSSNLEDKMRVYSPLGTGSRDPKDKAFDDLTRLYFVAFSRAQDVLLLVGLNSAIDGYIANEKQMNIPNVALGWRRDEVFIGFDEIFLI